MKYLARLKSEKQLPDVLPKLPEPLLTVLTVPRVGTFPENKGQGLPANQRPTTEKVDWLKPCPICSGTVFTESDRGGFFCCECQTLPDGAKPARIVESRKAQKCAAKITKLPRKQVTCQAHDHTGVLMSTHPDHCREYRGPFCSGCPILTIH